MARQVRPVDNSKGRGHQGVHTDDQHAAGKHGGPPEPRTSDEWQQGEQPFGDSIEHQSPTGHGKHAKGHKGQAEKSARDKELKP